MDFFTQGAQFSSLQQSQVVPRTIFVGNLSIYCSESELAEIFSAFGKIESIHLKKKEQGNLSYCFVKFTQRAAAEYAIASLNGNILHGRPLRLGWAVEYEDGTPIMKNETVVKSAPPPHAQIHVSFHAVLPQPVTESMIRAVFARFGEVKDVSIKKIQFNRETLQQSGYGFVHFPLDKEGIASAIQATETMNGNELNSIAFHCSVSHGLTRYIQANPHLNPRPSSVMVHYLAPSSSSSSPPPPMSLAGVGRTPSASQFSSGFPQSLATSQHQSYFPRSNPHAVPAAAALVPNSFEGFDSSYASSLQQPLAPRNEGGMFFPSSSSFLVSSASSHSSSGKSFTSLDNSFPEEILSRQFY